MKTLLLIQLAATLFMVGVIWFVQVVHYPLFDRADRTDFPAFAAEHQRLTGYVVGPPMLLELATALLLLAYRPHTVPAWQPWLGIALLAVAWGSTVLAQVPRHELLLRGYDEAVCQTLVSSNWWRTAAWSLRGVLVLWMVSEGMTEGGVR